MLYLLIIHYKNNAFGKNYVFLMYVCGSKKIL